MRQLKYMALALAVAAFGCTGQGINTADVYTPQGGTIDLNVDTVDPSAYGSVDFELDGKSLGRDEDSSDGWSYQLDSTTLDDGIHTVQAFGNTLEGTRVELLNNSLMIVNDGAGGTPPAGDEGGELPDEGTEQPADGEELPADGGEDVDAGTFPVGEAPEGDDEDLSAAFRRAR